MLSGLVTKAFPDRQADLEVRRGGILGLAGLVGAGRTSLARAVFGVAPALAGEIRLDGQRLRIRAPGEAIAQGIYLVPGDRKRSGVILDMTIPGNVTLPDLASHASGLLVPRASEARCAEAQRRSLGIRAPDVATGTGTLSGGNQQKVALAKWLAMRPRAILLDEPTRGVDMGFCCKVCVGLQLCSCCGMSGGETE